MELIQNSCTPKNTLPISIKGLIGKIYECCGIKNKKWAETFECAITNTWIRTLNTHENNTTFVITGDIPAMWLRDSSAQIRPYLLLAKNDPNIANTIAGVLKQQFIYINIDPYANAFNEEPNGAHWDTSDKSNFSSAWVWERKFELDSLCYPIQLAWLFYLNTNRTDHFDSSFIQAAKTILNTLQTEQDHANSPYFFTRNCDIPTESLINNGRGTAIKNTGMVWSGFRPSDDACTYHYLVPANMFATVILDYLQKIFTYAIPSKDLKQKAEKLCNDIQKGLIEYGKCTNIEGKEIWAYEVDGLGNRLIMDDSNVPSLLSAPYLGYCAIDDPTYLATRETILSEENPYYYRGSLAQGIGSNHTPKNYIWPIALCIQGLTTNNKQEKEQILNTLVNIDAGTHMMHEGINVDDSTQFTRPWFSWANMMFCELLLNYYGFNIKI